MVIVSSLDAAGRDDLVAARIMSTTSPHALGGLMSVVGEAEDQIPALTVICTYDSLNKIEQTQKTGYDVPPFDLAVMDEAHRIAGRADKKWAIVNDAKRIPADRRLYMTATPRIFAAPELAESADLTRPRRRRPQGGEVDAFANSMDNEQVYGKKVVEYPLATAVTDGRAAGYRIVVPTLTDTDLRRSLNLPAPGTTTTGAAVAREAKDDGALRTTALHLSVLRAMTEHGLGKVLVYFNLVSDARRFARELPHTLRLLAKTDPDLTPGVDPELFFAHGEHTPAQRADIFARFAAADVAILANSRLIAEGVDIPSVDAVVFADPTRSVIRCVQALGRALRLDVSGKHPRHRVRTRLGDRLRAGQPRPPHPRTPPRQGQPPPTRDQRRHRQALALRLHRPPRTHRPGDGPHLLRPPRPGRLPLPPPRPGRRPLLPRPVRPPRRPR
ncbi:helicase-related protein [Streptomyces cinerochromogenes]|uniref:Helicase-related protein n=1 Tax=Streptomyces cinerochromogenes TaxID=66422 RepID=A0ABW7BG10_9ACTN